MIGETKYHAKSSVVNGTSTTSTSTSGMLVGPQKYAKASSIYNATNGINIGNGGNTTSSITKELDASFNKISLSNGNPAAMSNTHSSNNNVKFIGFFDKQIDEREKYLTAKYPNHQMALIKKRLKVEFWIDEQLKCLFNIKDENKDDEYDICADDLVDTLLDLDTDHERKFHILVNLSANLSLLSNLILIFF